jgi:hypothetical protein
MLSYYYLRAASLREKQAGSGGVTASRCVGPLSRAVRGPFLGWLQAGVPSRKACRPGMPLNAKRSLIQGELLCPPDIAGEGNCPELSFWTVRGWVQFGHDAAELGDAAEVGVRLTVPSQFPRVAQGSSRCRLRSKVTCGRRPSEWAVLKLSLRILQFWAGYRTNLQLGV